MKARLLAAGEGCFSLQGALVFNTVAAVLALSEVQFKPFIKLSIDCCQVEAADSSAAALLLAWFRMARQLDKSIQFTSTPPSLRAIIAINELESVLPILD